MAITPVHPHSAPVVAADAEPRTPAPAPEPRAPLSPGAAVATVTSFAATLPGLPLRAALHAVDAAPTPRLCAGTALTAVLAAAKGAGLATGGAVALLHVLVHASHR
ncbi:conserved hypothetical protein [Actinosynnema mirum DSM 43827]|uniref:Uncharacterized protein n=1 Tax=Actinosynnema mirum (strain ATCC 29888 / DSM 43827 / JCM 3225 / NBRC 14064 / NCIMB 13271 / NRRL B-12336 / IMRU 3971 / 101) TaxID=446462 RepID=C6WJU4_ACTMD|nr:conserved hypothetical protein [Actinosynnema mirum DSM 43827]